MPITISWRNFSDKINEVKVTTGGSPCAVSTTEIQCTTSAVSLGLVPIVVYVKELGYSNNNVSFELTVNSISKSTGMQTLSKKIIYFIERQWI